MKLKMEQLDSVAWSTDNWGLLLAYKYIVSCLLGVCQWMLSQTFVCSKIKMVKCVSVICFNLVSFNFYIFVFQGTKFNPVNHTSWSYFIRQLIKKNIFFTFLLILFNQFSLTQCEIMWLFLSSHSQRNEILEQC